MVENIRSVTSKKTRVEDRYQAFLHGDLIEEYYWSLMGHSVNQTLSFHKDFKISLDSTNATKTSR